MPNAPHHQPTALDGLMLELYRRAYAALACERQLAIVPGATHLFEEPGALERVALLAGDWLVDHLAEHPAGTATST